MKVCIFGAGAVGSHIAARLAGAGRAEVSVVSRGAQLAAIRNQGLLLKSGGKEIRGKPTAATDDPASLPPQDLVLVTLKAHALPALVETFERMLAPHGSIVFLLNGITWWWRHGQPGARGPLPLLDPDGKLWEKLREKSLGCVIYSPNELEAPGVVVHIGANRWLIGEPSGETTPRLRAAVDLFNKSGLTAEIPADLRAEVWRKLVRNASSNTLAALTRLSMFEISSDAGLRYIAAQLIRETLAVAAALGWDLGSEIDPDQFAARGEKGGTRSSMLQDVLLGRPIEVNAIVGQTQAFAREAGVPVPMTDVIVPLLRGLDRSLRSS